MRTVVLLLILSVLFTSPARASKLPIKVENNREGAPVTLGIPFPKGALYSPDHVRLLNADGVELACQTTKVTTWEPADNSIKWLWVFFFTEKNSSYTLEYGPDVVPMPPKQRIISSNSMRSRGGIWVNTGPLYLAIDKKGNGFLDKVMLDANDDGEFTDDEILAHGASENRGTFFDLLDDNGVDSSRAVVHEVFREEGSGPLHSIFRIEGTYVYNREDNNPSPYTIYLHTYAGKSYIKVSHTLTYTGVPDKHQPQVGQHANIATQNKEIVSEETEDDPGWTQPNDQIQRVGLTFKYDLNDGLDVKSPMYTSKWYDDNPDTELYAYASGQETVRAMVQLGPERNNPEQHATPTQRADKFLAKAMEGPKCVKETEKAKGWMNIADGQRGIATGIKNFMKEYPKGLENNPVDTLLTTYLWPDEAGPMSFERMHTDKDGGMLGNFAQGITKTTEMIYYFHQNASEAEIDRTMNYSLNAPVARTTPSWYTRSGVYGKMAPMSTRHPEFENALQYKYDWWAFNQQWEPWYGIFDYGDGKSYYYKDKWIQWTNNEPTVDFMLWTNFMRTGDPEYYHLASAMSKHTMDVDNVHWPKKRTFVGADNDAIDFWNYKDEQESTPYLGIGRRHAEEHWYALLSAHVWIQGWIASYYLSADHRALDVAKMTGDTYIKRIWGDHDLRGRRLYLSVLNLVELYDATKLERYGKELDERVELMLEFQQEQGGNLLLDRYGYSQTYVAQGLYKYYQLTNSQEVKQALIDHATWVRKVPPYNHEMESYLATIYPLLLGYEFTGRESYLNEAKYRAEALKVDQLPKAIEKYASQEKLNEAMLEISNLPKSSRRFTNWEMNQGLRVFGWTHAYNIPYLLYYLDDLDDKVANK